jgi:hypothetical protein
MSGATDRAIRVATDDRAWRTAAIPRRVAPRAPHSRNAAAVDNEPRHRVRTSDPVRSKGSAPINRRAASRRSVAMSRVPVSRVPARPRAANVPTTSAATAVNAAGEVGRGGRGRRDGAENAGTRQRTRYQQRRASREPGPESGAGDPARANRRLEAKALPRVLRAVARACCPAPPAS